MPNTLRDFGMYLKQGLKHPFTTATWTPPRESFLDKVADAFPKKIDAILQLGVGGGLFMEKMLHERNQLAEDGVYIAVDCNKSWIEYIHKERPDVAKDPRVHFILKYAQHAREAIECILAERGMDGLDAALWTIPSTQMHKRDAWKVMNDTAALSRPNGVTIAYNVGSTEPLMKPHWKSVERVMKDYGANFGLPFLAFDTWMARNPVREQIHTTLNGKHLNGKHLNGHNGYATHLRSKAAQDTKRRWWRLDR